MEIRRLRPGDEESAHEMCAMMAAVFEEARDELDDAHVRTLLAREDFWAVVASDAGAVVGGVTAHTLPMTRSPSAELFIYDLAVRADRQRRGIGRALLTELLSLAAAAGIHTSFVAADDEDAHALDFYRALGGVASPVRLFTFSSRGRQQP
jgi:aminoglycoside 3-N-acetyltransferase I